MANVLTLRDGRLEQTIESWKKPYSSAEAIAEANRCLYCSDAPCIKACPTSINIPQFIRRIATGNTTGAARTILDANVLGYSCSKVCPVEVLCVGDCVYSDWGRDPIQIGKLQHHAVKTAREAGVTLLAEQKTSSGRSVGFVGAGPASIAAAAMLAAEGHRCVIYDKKQLPGGLNTYGIAPYKMQGDDSLAEIAWLAELDHIEFRGGIEVVEDATTDAQISATQLLADFDAVFFAPGIGGDRTLDIGQHANVVGATDWIAQIKANADYRLPDGVHSAVVVGGGNTALDAAHELVLLGVPEVKLVYRRNQAAMTGYAHELASARKDGVKFVENRSPVGILTDGDALTGLRVVDAQGGRAIDGSEHDIACQLIILAVGQDRWNHLTRMASLFQIETDERGCVVVNPQTARTSNPDVWSAGDCVNGGKEVVNAVGEAKIAVENMLQMLKGDG